MPIDPQTGMFLANYAPPNPTPNDTPYFKEQRYAPFTRMLAPENRSNLVQFLGGLGAEIDPRGAGGMIGRQVVNTQRQMDYQKATEKSIARNDNFMKNVFEMMAGIGLTPEGKKGGTSLKMNPDRTVSIKANLVDEPEETESGGERVSMTRPRPGEAATEQYKKYYGQPVEISPSGESTWDPADEQYITDKIVQTPLPQQQSQVLPQSNIPTRNEPKVMAPVAPGEPSLSQRQQLKRGLRNVPKQRSTIDPVLEERLKQVPVPEVPKPQKSSESPLQPGPMLAGEGTAETPMVMPSTTTTATREGVASGLRSTDQGTVLAALLAGYSPTQVQQPQYLTAPPIDTTIVGGGGFVAPPSDTLLPTPRQRSQSLFDVRNFIPF